jgi:trans-L-3-hydroxyproline dehydratase
MHTGAPLLIITSGIPDLPGDTVLAKCSYFRDHYDDRFPTNSGVSARAALHSPVVSCPSTRLSRSKVPWGATTSMQAVEATQFGPHAAIVPEVSGTAHITGRNELYLDPDDPLGKGFNFR